MKLIVIVPLTIGESLIVAVAFLVMSASIATLISKGPLPDTLLLSLALTALSPLNELETR